VKLHSSILLTAVVLILLGCAKKEEILEGQRFDITTPLDQAVPTADGVSPSAIVENRVAKIRLPKVTNLSSWTHRNSGPDHLAGNLALSEQLTQLWSVKIGSGNDRQHRITSDPIVAQGLIFTLDSQSHVMAHSPIGTAVWQRDLTPASDKAGEASGGGLAFADGVLYATTGYGVLTAINAADGTVKWEQKLDAPISAAPTVIKDRVFVIRLWVWEVTVTNVI